MNYNHDEVNVVSTNNVEITKEDVARLIQSIAYRKAYNQRPDVKASRKEYNRKRSRKMAAVREYVKQHPEVAL